jgi:hypothetical protein
MSTVDVKSHFPSRHFDRRQITKWTLEKNNQLFNEMPQIMDIVRVIFKVVGIV